MVSSSSSSNVDRLTNAVKSSSTTCTSSCSSYACSSTCSCTARSYEPAIMFHPIAISTPANIIDCNTSIKQDMSGYVNHLSIDRSIDILNSTTYNQQHSLDTILDESMNVLPAGVASDHLLLSLGSTITEKSTTKKRNKTLQDLKISDYLHVTNGDQFNDEIKLLANGRYIESSIYTAKKEKFASTNDYRKKQEDVAAAVFEQESFTGVRGKQIRDNIDYELQMIKKQKTMEYKPVYDPSSFKIPDEHQQNIEEWLNNDFRMRIDGRITRSRYNAYKSTNQI
ncbi:unnamed protein product [Rotaria sordida]|uniref:Uncharacterized protein n=1 Tax=Rotaria sordida TaxID=392033 RepID=A0A814I567_9BILA|nr:unnamed protein product [Rotaria sordida]